MSTTEHIRDGVAVTRYCGAGNTPGPHRIRLRIDTDAGTVAGITVLDALQIAKALVHLAIDAVYGEMETNGNARPD
jgi:hypothetical protein